MILRLSEIAHPSMRRVGPIPMALALALVIVSVNAWAQTWQVDSRLSVARLSLGPESHGLEIGVARISGQVVFDSDHPANPTVDLKIAPGNDTGLQSVRMDFTSKQSAMTRNGMLIVSGNLAVTRVERSMTMDPTEAFAGSVYGEPVDHIDIHPITFVFDLPPQSGAYNSTIQLSGSTSVARGDFPQFLDALILAKWPTQLINDRKCELPLTFGEDYSGAKCTGTLIASVSNAEARIGSGEDFAGFRPDVPPNFNQGTLTMDLSLTRTKSAPSSVSAATAAAHRIPLTTRIRP